LWPGFDSGAKHKNFKLFIISAVYGQLWKVKLDLCIIPNGFFSISTIKLQNYRNNRQFIL